MPLRLLLADDHQVVLDGLKALLAGEADMTVVGQATDGLQVLLINRLPGNRREGLARAALRSALGRARGHQRHTKGKFHR